MTNNSAIRQDVYTRVTNKIVAALERGVRPWMKPWNAEHAERFFAETEATIRHGGNRAYYSLGSDHIQMPPFEAFRDAKSYYATLAHETTHWTRHPSRLERGFGRESWGDEGYAREEPVAELGAAFLCADLGITPEVREDYSACIACWLEVLKGDKRAIFQAAAHAQRAARSMPGLHYPLCAPLRGAVLGIDPPACPPG
jgi:antirestriction protein ArdC